MSNYYYVIGEQQSAVIPESLEIRNFTRDKMAAVDTEELHLVIGNVFGKGEFFPGPQEVLTSVIHELVRRWDKNDDTDGNYCVIISVFRLLTGQLDVHILAKVPLSDENISTENTESFYSILLHSLPTFQEELVKKAYAPDSKLVAVIKDSAEFHQLKKQ